MKYGVVVFEKTENIGDDIQSYAASQLLPQVDYYIEREHLDVFRPLENEPVNTILNGWLMHNKLGWPISNCINPLYISMHFLVEDSLKVGCDFLKGLGGEDLLAHAPIGCRDLETQAFLEENGISTYFSGCLTLTLDAKFPKLETEPYVCLTDVSPQIIEFVKKQYPDMNIKIIEHEPNQMPALVKHGISWEDRFKEVEKLLTIYQNAHAVITSRLHCALPCLALGTPVLLLNDAIIEAGRFDGLSALVHCTSNEDFLTGKIQFSLVNPPANGTAHLAIRNNLIAKVNEFIENYSVCTEELTERFLKYDSEWEKRAIWKNELLFEINKKHIRSYNETFEYLEELEAGRKWLENQYFTLTELTKQQAETIDSLNSQLEKESYALCHVIQKCQNYQSELNPILNSRWYRLGKKIEPILKMIRRK